MTRKKRSPFKLINLILALTSLAAGLTLLGIGISYLHVVEERILFFYAQESYQPKSHYELLLKNGWSTWNNAILIFAILLIGIGIMWLCLIYYYKDKEKLTC